MRTKTDWTALAAKLAELAEAHPSIGKRLWALVMVVIEAAPDPEKLFLINLALYKARQELARGLECKPLTLKELVENLRTDLDLISDKADKLSDSVG